MSVYSAIITVVCFYLALALFFQYKKTVYWHDRWQDAITDLCPIEWDYARKQGWREDLDDEAD